MVKTTERELVKPDYVYRARLDRVIDGDTIDVNLRAQTFEVFLNKDGKLRWRGFEDGEEVIYKKEPKTTWSQRFWAGFMRLMPVRGQL